jgi:hypothetical protein
MTDAASEPAWLDDRRQSRSREFEFVVELAFNAESTKCGGVDLIRIILHFSSGTCVTHDPSRVIRKPVLATVPLECGMQDLWYMDGRNLINLNLDV